MSAVSARPAAALLHAEGRDLRGPLALTCDVVVVGSGPAGAAVARSLARAGADVVVLEEGPLVTPERFPLDGFTSLAGLYRELGGSLLYGRSPMPFVQGRAVGGTSVVNGAISWRLPADVLAAWVAADPALGETLPLSLLEEVEAQIERDLSIAPTDAAIAGPKNLLMARGAEALGLAHRPISRNVSGCEGLGRCLQGCPKGHKQSMDLTYLPDARAAGARILSEVRVDGLEVRRGVATGVHGKAAGGGKVSVQAKRAVVLAASAMQTPALLLSSGIRHGPTGHGLQCHPGFSVSGRFPEPVRMWRGATQGHEITGLRNEGLKFEVLGFDLSLQAMRLPGLGSAFSRELAAMDHWLCWGVAVKAAARGRVRPGSGGRVKASYELERGDLARARKGIRILGEAMLAAGATEVAPGVHGFAERVTDRAAMARFEDEAPWDPRAYTAAVTHLFATCRMGSEPATSVVRPDFRHHAVDRLYLADSSVFPGNTGVNPQTAILALATICARGIAG